MQIYDLPTHETFSELSISNSGLGPIARYSPAKFAALTIDELLLIPQSDYAGINVAHMAALSQNKVHAIHIDWLSLNAIGGLTVDNIKGIIDKRYFSEWITDPAQITAISPKAFAALDIDQLLAISKSNYRGITDEQIAALPLDKVHAIHIDWLTASAIGGLTADNINGITDLRYFNEWSFGPAQIAAIKPKAFAALDNERLWEISESNYKGITDEQIAALPLDKVHTIHINWLSESAIRGFTAANINGIVDLRYFKEWSFGPLQIGAFNAQAFAALDNERLWEISESNYKGITKEQIAALPFDKVHTIHINWLSESAIRGFTAANINGIVDRRYFSDWITDPGQITAINPRAFAALDIDQLLAISRSNYRGISNDQIAALPLDKVHTIHINWLSESAIRGFTAANINGIVDRHYFSEWITDPAQIAAINPDAFAALTPTQLSWFSHLNSSALAGISGAQLRNLSAQQAQAFLLESIVLISPKALAAAGSGFTSNLSDEQINKLTQDQINAVLPFLSPERFSQVLSVARVGQISEEVWAQVSREQMSALSPEAFAAMLPNQLSALTRAAVLGITSTQMSVRFPLGSTRAAQDLDAIRVIANQPHTPGRTLTAVNNLFFSEIYSVILNNFTIGSEGGIHFYDPYAGGYGYGYGGGGGGGSGGGGGGSGGSEGQPTITTQQLLDANTVQITTWRVISPADLRQVVSSLTPEQAARLSGAQVVALRECLSALAIEAIPVLINSTIRNIDLDHLTNAQLRAMGQSQVQALNLASISPKRLVELGVGFIDKLAAGQLSSGQVFQLIQGLTPSQLGTSNLQFMSGLSPVEMAFTFSRVGGNYLAALSADLMNRIFGGFTSAYMASLGSSDSATIESFAGMVLPASYGLLSPQTVASISPEVLGALLPTQVAALNITSLSGNVIARAGIGFVNGLSDTQVTHLHVSQQLVGLLTHLTPTEFAQINAAFFSALPVGALAEGLKSVSDSSHLQFDALMAALTADQADAIFEQLIPTERYFAGLVGPTPEQRANHEKLIAFAKVLPTTVYSNLSFDTLSKLRASNLFEQLSTQQREATDALNILMDRGTEGLLNLSAHQIGGLTIPQINALLTHSVGFANVMLNMGAPNAWSREQFEAMLAIPGVIASLNPTVLGNSLSVNALLNLTVGQIGQLTGGQWQAILNNPTLSKVVFNAGHGAGYWSLAQLQAVSSAAIPYMTQDQYLQFEDGLVMFSQAQRGAMARNVAIVVIMFTGRTDGWTQDQIARVVNTVPGMIPLSGLPGGGGCFGMPRDVANQHRMTNYATTNDPSVLGLALYPEFLATLSERDREDLLSNKNVRPLLAEVTQEQLVNIMSSPDLMGALFGANFLALATPIANFIRNIGGATLQTLLPLNNFQINALVSSEQGHIALGQIFEYAPRLIPDGSLTSVLVDRLITTDRGRAIMSRITEDIPGVLANGAITANVVVTLIKFNRLRPGRISVILETIVERLPTAFAADALSADIVLELMMVKGNSPNWAADFFIRIAQTLPVAFATGALNVDLIEILISREGGLAALGKIAQSKPAAFANGAFTAKLIKQLVKNSTDFEILLNVLPSYTELMASPAEALTQISNAITAPMLTLPVIERLAITPGGLLILNQLPVATVREIPADLAKLDVYALIKLMNECRSFINNLTTIQAKSLFADPNTRIHITYYLNVISNNMSASFLNALVHGSYYQNLSTDITGMSLVPQAALAGLNPVEANRLEPFFWTYITTAQLTAMMDSGTLGAGYFGNIGVPNPTHIQLENMQKIYGKTLAAAFKATKSQEVRDAIRHEKDYLSDDQRQIFMQQDIEGFLFNVPQNLMLETPPTSAEVIRLLQAMAIEPSSAATSATTTGSLYTPPGVQSLPTVSSPSR